MKKLKKLFRAAVDKVLNWCDGYERKHIARRLLWVLLLSPFLLAEFAKQACLTGWELLVELHDYIRFNH